jgi:type III secretion system low calcium response chaperone LcrH/SycD
MDELDRFRIPTKSLELLKDPSVLLAALSEGKIVQEILGFSQEVMDKFYEIAYQLYYKKDYHSAADAFVFLTSINPCVHLYWIGLGMSEQMLGEYEAALMAYTLALMTDASDPLAYYHSAACHHALGAKDEMIAALRLAIACSEHRPEHQVIYLHAQNLLKTLS